MQAAQKANMKQQSQVELELAGQLNTQSYLHVYMINGLSPNRLKKNTFLHALGANKSGRMCWAKPY